MPTANGDYYGNGNAVYDDYDYSDSSPHNTTYQHKEDGILVNGNYHHDAYQPAGEERASFQKTGTKPRLKVQPQDEISRHMLYETALVDCKAFDILSLEEVDALKKDLARIVPRIDATQRKLMLERKVKDAAQNLQKLSSRNGRADTPQSPESPRKVRPSLLDRRQSVSSANGDGHIEEELLSSQKKVDELSETLRVLLSQRAEVEGKLLRHTAAVLAQQREDADTQYSSARQRSYDDDALSEYEADEFDGIRDILGGRTINRSSKRTGTSRVQEDYLQSVQTRLEGMNQQMRQIIEQAGRARGVSVPPESLQPPIADATERINRDLARLASSVALLEQEQTGSQELGAKLEAVNNNLHQALTNSSRQLDQQPALPPQTDDHHEHVSYLQSLIATVEHVFHMHDETSGALAKTAGQRQRLEEYEATVGGLWDILATESSDSDAGSNRSSRLSERDAITARSPRISESFSLAAFSSRVQHVVNRANAAKDQQDILRRQIQQQRELNGKSDAEKDTQIETLQGNHDRMLAQHSQMQDELHKSIANHASSESEASHLRSELGKVENEFEQLRQAADARQQQHEELSRQVQMHQANHEQARGELAEAQTQLAQISAAKSKKDKDTEGLEAEIVRLTTELTMTKAELEGAYGSRAERAKEAQDGEVRQLKERSSTLERELTAMTNEFEELTRESLELERERSHLDGIIDGLRERCESLETQLSDEKVRRLGVSSPSTDSPQHQQTKEQTSMVVMRSEFKKMMRDARMEGVKLLRAEQEQRRALEAELRRLRQANTPLRKALPDPPAA